MGTNLSAQVAALLGEAATDWTEVDSPSDRVIERSLPHLALLPLPLQPDELNEPQAQINLKVINRSPEVRIRHCVARVLHASLVAFPERRATFANGGLPPFEARRLPWAAVTRIKRAPVEVLDFQQDAVLRVAVLDRAAETIEILAADSKLSQRFSIGDRPPEIRERKPRIYLHIEVTSANASPVDSWFELSYGSELVASRAPFLDDRWMADNPWSDDWSDWMRQRSARNRRSAS